MNTRFAVLAVLCFLLMVTLVGCYVINLSWHEAGHKAGCGDLGGKGTVTYKDFFIGGSTRCEGLPKESEATYYALSAAHEFYTYQIDTLIVAIIVTAGIVLLGVAFFIETAIDELRVRQ